MKRKIKYLVYSLTVILMSLFVIVGCSDDDADPINPPTITTLAVTDITETSAKSGGNITDDGGGEITARGVVWGTDVNPSLENHSGVTVDGIGSGIFQSNITGLIAETTYYVRAYAINSAGTSYGNDVMFETDEIEQLEYSLTIEVNPQDAGSVTGAGSYNEGEQVNITANANEGWEFVEWIGDTEYVDNPDSGQSTVNMPADDVSLTAVFQEEDGSDIIYGDGVTDIDGNEYVTVIIGDQEWMAENLRVTRYNNGDEIPTDLNNEDWKNTTEGAYAIYYNDDQMLIAYGALYNWYAVDDGRGLCPEGWSVPSHDDWTQFEQYICNALGNSDCETHFPYDNTTTGWRGTNEGNALKSCRQENSPLEGCNTSEHPRWNSDDTHYGFDAFGFSALPGGVRLTQGYHAYIGLSGSWWSSSESSATAAWFRGGMTSYRENVSRGEPTKSNGCSVRCLRDIVPTEDE